MGLEVVKEAEVKDEQIRSASLLVLGLEGSTITRLFGGGTRLFGGGTRLFGGGTAPFLSEVEPVGSFEGFIISVVENPINPERVVAVAYGSSKAEVDAAAGKVARYGGYSSLRFREGKNIEKKTAKTESGIVVSLRAPVTGIRPERAIGLDAIIKDVTRKKVIYVGESHTAYEDHRVQLDIIRAMHAEGKKFAIGMEMFQRPFQKALDDFMAGSIGEKEFLKASEYFKRWQFNYHLYREIVDFARTNGIPVLALNLRDEVVRKVSAGGLDALSPEDRKEIPVDMDMADAEYRERLRDVFERHRRPNGNFENFYQSQVLWDETMAHSIGEFLRNNPDHQMVVLAGAGHVIYGSGIPKRAFRLTGMDYAILINANIDTPAKGIADYVLFPAPLNPPVPPELMVSAKKTPEGLMVEGFPPGSVSQRAGIRAGDIVLSVDGLKVDDVEDVRIALYDKRRGDKVRVKVLRKRFLFGSRELEVEVAF
jgi:uncharacterized iron-regulated protein